MTATKLLKKRSSEQDSPTAPGGKKLTTATTKQGGDPAIKLKELVENLKEESMKKDLDKVGDLRILLNSRKERGEWECVEESCHFTNPVAVAKCKKCGLSRFLSPAKKPAEDSDSEPERRSSSSRQSRDRSRSASWGWQSPFRRLSQRGSQERPGSEEDRKSRHLTRTTEKENDSPREKDLKARRRSVSSTPPSEKERWESRTNSSSAERDGSDSNAIPDEEEARDGMDVSLSPSPGAVEPVVPSYDEFQDTLRHHMTRSSRLIHSNSSLADKEAGATNPRRLSDDSTRDASASQSDDDDESGRGSAERGRGRSRKTAGSDRDEKLAGMRVNPSGSSLLREDDDDDDSDGSFEGHGRGQLNLSSQSMTPLSRSLSRSSR